MVIWVLLVISHKAMLVGAGINKVNKENEGSRARNSSSWDMYTWVSTDIASWYYEKNGMTACESKCKPLTIS